MYALQKKIVYIFSFYSKVVLLIASFIIPVQMRGEELELGVCTKCGKEQSVDCTEYSPGTEYLQPSLFPFVPPYLKFFKKYSSDGHTKKMPKHVPEDIQKYLKWANIPERRITLKNVLGSSGFTIIPKNDNASNYQYLGSWERSDRCRTPYQKGNYMSHYMELENKARMWINVKRGIEILGKESFDFIPKTFVLPSDMEEFKIAYNKSGNQLWLVKQTTSYWARGMYFVRNIYEIPKTQKRVLVVQKFLQNQYLMDGRKVDVRFHVLTTSYNPLRVYLANEYIVVTGRSNYTIETGDPCVLLLRYSASNPQKCHRHHIINSDPRDSTRIGTKSQLFTQLTSDGLDAERFEEKLHDGIVKILLTTLRPAGNEYPDYTRYNGYKLWDGDAVIDDHGNPVIIEFNSSPAVSGWKGRNDLMIRTKDNFLADALSVAGFNLPPFMSAYDKECVIGSLNTTYTLESPVFDERLYPLTNLSEEAKLKQKKYRISGPYDGSTSHRESILDNLTPDDVRQLMLAEDELSRSIKGFIRLYPAIGMDKYMPLSQFDPYYDKLFDAWETKYHLNRTDGIRRLQLLAQQKYHLLK